MEHHLKAKKKNTLEQETNNNAKVVKAQPYEAVKQIESVGVDNSKISIGTFVERKPQIKPSNVYPLGKPVPRPPFKKPPVPKLPVENKKDSSFFDFLPFWNSAPATQPKRPLPPPPRRPLGPTVTKLEQNPQPDYPKGLQAPLLLKVDSELPPPSKRYPIQELPERPQLVEEPSQNARIDNTIHTDIADGPEEAFIVLPAEEPKPKIQSQKERIGPVPNYPKRPL